MDLYLDQDAFEQAIAALGAKREELNRLRENIEKTIMQLKSDWISQASDVFFKKYEKDLMQNLMKYALVFEYIHDNLKAAKEKYQEVFDAADAVANLQY